MKNALITGAGGFIGLHTVKEFVRRGWRVFALVHRKVPEELEALVLQGKVSLRSCDIREARRFEEIVASLPRLDVIVHCAARASDVGRDRDFRSSNFEAVRHLTAMVRQYDAGVLVFVSTTDVYGMHDFNGEREDELPLEMHPGNPYPKYKILAEQWIRKYLPEDRFSILRPAAVWGRDDPTLTLRIKNFLSWSPFIIHFGPWKGQNRWPLAHVDRVAKAAFAAASNPGARGKAINILDERRTSIDAFYRQVAKWYFPQKEFRLLCLPLWCGKCIGLFNSALANICGLEKPLLDPTLYAVRSVSSNLDFSCSRLEKLLEEDSGQDG